MYGVNMLEGLTKEQLENFVEVAQKLIKEKEKEKDEVKIKPNKTKQADAFDIRKHREQRSQGRGNKGKPSRIESYVPRKMQFVDDKEVGTEFSEEDREYWKDRQPTKRRQSKKKIQTECRICKDMFDIFPSQINKEGEFVCNGCCSAK